ncbi:DUF485 domain-containing protein [Actinomadura sediminis]|uniref:DUF485 domain-containing protein n=1 Tax=Actinomadura sediminis TaxID=1038904 RepID=A0ABW3ERL6_9ACTN
MVGGTDATARRGAERGRRVPPGRYAAIAGDERFRRLDRRFRRTVAVGAGAFLGWYFLYVALSAFARGFMARPVAGNVNVAMLLGVLQFASTLLLAAAFAAYARRRLDPLADELRAEADGPPAPPPGAAPAAYPAPPGRPAPVAPRASDGRWDVRMGEAR